MILNIKPNHLDHHIRFADYLEAKLKLLKNTTPKDYLVYNADDSVLSAAVRKFDLQKFLSQK